jgi:hypothetical protein
MSEQPLTPTRPLLCENRNYHTPDAIPPATTYIEYEWPTAIHERPGADQLHVCDDCLDRFEDQAERLEIHIGYRLDASSWGPVAS